MLSLNRRWEDSVSIQRLQQSLLSGLLLLAPMWRTDAAIDINGTEVPGCGET
jgi:hypothetical protein